CIYGSIPEIAYAYVRYSEGVDVKGRVLKYDIDITDEAGRIVVAMKEFMVRALQRGGGEGVGPEARSESGVLYATTRWEEDVLGTVEGGQRDADRLIVLAGGEEWMRELLSGEYPDAEVIGLSASVEDAGLNVESWFVEVFEKIRGRLEGRPKRVQRILVLVPDGDDGYCYAPVAGLLRTARIENPRIEGRVIYSPVLTDDNREQFAAMVRLESASGAGVDIEVRYDEGFK
ncbi:MAG: hypothetical protein GY721_13495, partial [Deltaproteobacteria bacterium]|nr:hypothetical protein [Deltaproteobacteria bacterium]